MKLEDIKKLCDAATPGPWDEVPTKKMNAGVGPSMNGPETYEDAQFIAMARATLPKLLAVAEAAETMHDTYYSPGEMSFNFTSALVRLKEALSALEAQSDHESK